MHTKATKKSIKAHSIVGVYNGKKYIQGAWNAKKRVNEKKEGKKI